jgi:hypothetical protein
MILFVHDPKNISRFLTAGPWADRSWFSEAAVKVMATDSKSAPEWSEVFRIAYAQAYGHHSRRIGICWLGSEPQDSKLEGIQSGLRSSWANFHHLRFYRIKTSQCAMNG